jgi:cytochrome c556
MYQKSMKKKLFRSLLLLPALFASLALAHSGVKDRNVMARMMLMSNMASNMKVIGKMAKATAQFDKDQAVGALLEIARLAKETPAAFEKQATDPKSEAKAEIWTEFDDFKTISETLRSDAASLAGSLSTAQDLRPALIKLSQSCKGCHSRYRE